MLHDRSRIHVRVFYTIAVLLVLSLTSFAQDCRQDKEIDAPIYSAITNAASQYLQMASRGDAASLRAASMPILSNSFDGVAQSVVQYKEGLVGSARVHHVYLLDASTFTGERAEFFCGVYGATGHTARSTSFSIPGLPQGRYALIVQEVASAKGPHMLTLILQQQATEWKIAGFYLKPMTVNGKNAQWFVDQAQQYQKNGDKLTAYLYYYQAWDLVSPVNFISTQTLDRLGQLIQETRPADVPADQPVQLAANGRTFSVTQMFPVVDQDKLALVVKWQAADLNDTAKLFQDNTAVMKALVAKYPSLRQSFQQIVARAVAPSGQDYGTALPVDQIK